MKRIDRLEELEGKPEPTAAGHLADIGMKWLEAHNAGDNKAAAEVRQEAEPIFTEHPELRECPESVYEKIHKHLFLDWQLFVGYPYLKELYEAYFHLFGMVLKGDKAAVLKHAKKAEKIFQKYTGQGFPANDLLNPGSPDWFRMFQIVHRKVTDEPDGSFYGSAEECAERMIKFYINSDNLEDFHFMTGLEKYDGYTAGVGSGGIDVCKQVRQAMDRHFRDLRKWAGKNNNKTTEQ